MKNDNSNKYFVFDRYVKGEKMNQGVAVKGTSDFNEAINYAYKIVEVQYGNRDDTELVLKDKIIL